MKAFQVPADEITCNALISTYGNSVLWQRSIQVLAKMDARRLEPERLWPIGRSDDDDDDDDDDDPTV